MKVVIAPDSFKGSLPAVSVAAAIAHGWRSQRPDDEIIQIPLADGGEGSIDSLHRVRGGTIINTKATNPIGNVIDTQWLLLPDGTAIIELAKISGLHTFSPLQPLRAHTFGLGEVIKEAENHPETRQIVICLGGSGTNDAGLGACTALGSKFLDSSNNEIFPIPENFERITQITMATPLQHPITVLSDVCNPLFGTKGSAFNYARQKGANDDQIAFIDKGHRHIAEIAGGEPDVPGAGAAGGCGYGLATLLNASIEPGALTMIQESGFVNELKNADLLITGEGCLDSQSLNGKLISHQMKISHDLKVPIAAIVGNYKHFENTIHIIKSLSEIAPSKSEAIINPSKYLIEASSELALVFSG